ncbi:MAG: hypothetical protein IJV15_05145 [Lachnospiraceae bacterium]|nr:hypothetical protein [Lachnospiraceae bacterium]
MKVSKRGGFSDRLGIKKENTEIQLKDFDQRTRIQIQNKINSLYEKVYFDDLYYGREEIQDFFRYILGNVYAASIDISETYSYTYIFAIMNDTFISGDYDDVLTLIEAVAQYWDNYLKEKYKIPYPYYDERYKKGAIFKELNELFTQEYIGYRFIGDEIVPISDKTEVGTINEALNCKYQAVNEHLIKANKFLSDRKNPDYENSIKESISAVEALCEIYTGIRGKAATLGSMLKKMEDNGIKIHAGLKSAFNILYGYTSDANGIRHAGDIGGPASTFEEAKYMLVSCSAFINYLKALDAK